MELRNWYNFAPKKRGRMLPLLTFMIHKVLDFDQTAAESKSLTMLANPCACGFFSNQRIGKLPQACQMKCPNNTQARMLKRLVAGKDPYSGANLPSRLAPSWMREFLEHEALTP